MTNSTILGIALGAGLGGVIVGNTSAGASISPLSVTAHSLLMVGMLLIALWIAPRLSGRPQRVAI